MQKQMDYYKKLILYFFLFSFIGWLLETAYSYSELGYFVKRGFLYGPICPIYGFGAIILIKFLGKHEKQSLRLFLYSAVTFSVFEYIVGFCLDALFGAKWWDYSTEILNLNGRISILFSIAWGIIAILFINHLYPFWEKKINVLLNKLSLHFQNFFIILLITIFIVDEIFSFIKYLS